MSHGRTSPRADSPMKTPRSRAAKSPRVKLVMQSESDFESCAERLRALADPDRLRIVTALLDGPKNVSQLSEELSMAMVNLSHHLRVLRYAHVVRTEEGRQVRNLLARSGDIGPERAAARQEHA